MTDAKRTTIVTGAGRGIGLETACAFAELGDRVIAIDMSEELLAEAGHELCDKGHEVETVTLDVTDQPAIAALVKDLDARYGAIDVLANVHGICTYAKDGQGPVEADSVETWDRVMGVNFMGVVHLCQAVLPIMKRQRHGRIVTVSSIAARVAGNVSAASYSASKAAVVNFMKSVAREGGPYTVTANCVAPGNVETEMLTQVLNRMDGSTIIGRTPLGRYATVREVANVIMFLASDSASYVTGQDIAVNGGQLMP